MGTTTAENFAAVKAQRSSLCRYDHLWGLADCFTASLFTAEQNRQLTVDGLTRFESLAVRSILQALRDIKHLQSKNVFFILSTTKANIELLDEGYDVGPATAAQHIAQYLGFVTQPLTVCNACISGLSAIITANRLLDAGCYDYAVVCGADVQSLFTVAGFESLKAVSQDDCRPFDMERTGLNLGEAAATLVLQREPEDGGWAIVRGSVTNDAYHISSPSRNGDGAQLALQAVVDGIDTETLAFVNAHGTATLFNDQMESVAIEHAGLKEIPVNSYKGYFRHTLGAAGILETVLSMAAVDEHTVIGTRGYTQRGVSGCIQLAADHCASNKQTFVKMISGFGGCNAALLVSKTLHSQTPKLPNSQTLISSITLTPSSLVIGGKALTMPTADNNTLTQLYKEYIGVYPKFHKMDGLSRLGFVASELLLRSARLPASTAVVLFNHHSSLATDRHYHTTLADFPSPSLFVYTLPNIVCGEIAIRNGFRSETSFYIVPSKDEAMMDRIVSVTAADPSVSHILYGWIDYNDESDFEAEMHIVEVL